MGPPPTPSAPRPITGIKTRLSTAAPQHAVSPGPCWGSSNPPQGAHRALGVPVPQFPAPPSRVIVLEHAEIIPASSISPCSFLLPPPGLMGLLSPAQTHSLFLIGHKSRPQNNPGFCPDLVKYSCSLPGLRAIPSPGTLAGTNRWHRPVRGRSCSGRGRGGGEAADAARKEESPRHPAVPVASSPLSWQRVTAGKGQGMEGTERHGRSATAEPVQLHSSNPAASGAAKASREHSQTPNPSPEPSRVRARFPARCELLGAGVGFVPTSHRQTRAPPRGGIACAEPRRGCREASAHVKRDFIYSQSNPPKKNT